MPIAIVKESQQIALPLPKKETFPSFQTVKKGMEILCIETFAFLTGIIPNALKWCYRVHWTKEITPFLLTETVGKVNKTAVLYRHGHLENQATSSNRGILILHGDHGHPFSTLELADIAQKCGVGPVFSLYVKYDDSVPEIHRNLMTQAIDKIQALMTQQGGLFKGITAVGHSKGVTESAYLAFAQGEKRIQALVSFAGRLRVTPSCHEELKPRIDKIYQALIKRPNFPLYTISAEKDWMCKELESTQIFPGKNSCLIAGASHTSLLFHKEAQQRFQHYLKLSS